MGGSPHFTFGSHFHNWCRNLEQTFALSSLNTYCENLVAALLTPISNLTFCGGVFDFQLILFGALLLVWGNKLCINTPALVTLCGGVRLLQLGRKTALQLGFHLFGFWGFFGLTTTLCSLAFCSGAIAFQIFTPSFTTFCGGVTPFGQSAISNFCELTLELHTLTRICTPVLVTFCGGVRLYCFFGFSHGLSAFCRGAIQFTLNSLAFCSGAPSEIWNLDRFRLPLLPCSGALTHWFTGSWGLFTTWIQTHETQLAFCRGDLPHNTTAPGFTDWLLSGRILHCFSFWPSAVGSSKTNQTTVDRKSYSSSIQFYTDNCDTIFFFTIGTIVLRLSCILIGCAGFLHLLDNLSLVHTLALAFSFIQRIGNLLVQRTLVLSTIAAGEFWILLLLILVCQVNYLGGKPGPKSGRSGIWRLVFWTLLPLATMTDDQQSGGPG